MLKVVGLIHYSKTQHTDECFALDKNTNSEPSRGLKKFPYNFLSVFHHFALRNGAKNSSVLYYTHDK